MTLNLNNSSGLRSVERFADVREVLDRSQRERLLAAMVALVGETGYAGATVTKLASHAGMSTKTFYRHFSDRSDCFLAAYDEAVDHIVSLVIGACRGASDPPERLDRAVTAGLRHCADEPGVARLCIVEIHHVGPAGIERRTQTMLRLAALAEDALANARHLAAPGRRSGLLPEVLVGGIFHIAYDFVRTGRAAQLPELAPELTRVFARAA